MEFNWINLFNAITIILILIPNIIFAIKNKGSQVERAARLVCVIEQIFRYACMILMILPIFTWEFGFSPLEFMFSYLIGNVILLILYFIFWGLYFKRNTISRALALAIIPVLIFANTAISVKHWALLAAAIVFGACHIYITYQNNKEEIEK